MTESDDDTKDDTAVIFSPEALQRMNDDPALQEAMRFFTETMHTAIEGVKSGRYANLDDAMETLLGSKPVKIDVETGEVITGASMHDEMFGEVVTIDLRDDDDDADC